jgi:hypothetical protein
MINNAIIKRYFFICFPFHFGEDIVALPIREKRGFSAQPTPLSKLNGLES